MRSFQEIRQILSEKISSNLIDKKPLYQRDKATGKPKKCGDADYISWPNVIRLLDRATDGFYSWEIRSHYLGDRVVIEGRLSIQSSDGIFVREASGYEFLECGSFGDATSNAEAMALRRAAAKFGLALYLWKEERDILEVQASRVIPQIAPAQPQKFLPKFSVANKDAIRDWEEVAKIGEQQKYPKDDWIEIVKEYLKIQGADSWKLATSEQRRATITAIKNEFEF